MERRYDAPFFWPEERKAKAFRRRLLYLLKKRGLISPDGKAILSFDLIRDLINFRLPEDESDEEAEWEFEIVWKIYDRLLINSEYADGEEVFLDEGFIELFENITDEVLFEEFIEEMITTDAEDSTSLMNRGNAYCQKGMVWEALLDYAQAMRMNPNDPTIYFNRACLFMKIGEYERAIEEITRALRKGGLLNWESAYALRSEAFFKVGQLAEAIADLSQVLKGLKKRWEKLSGNQKIVANHMVNHRWIIENGIRRAVDLIKEMDGKEMGSHQREAIERLKEEILFLRNLLGI